MKLIPKLQNGKYIVKSGDNLSTIAKTYNINVNDLMKSNNITNANSIKIGQPLSIPGKTNQTTELSDQDKVKFLISKGYDVNKWDSAAEDAWDDYQAYYKGSQTQKCDDKGCAWYVNNIHESAGGDRYGNAWNALQNIKDSGGQVKYNAYEGQTFKTIDDVKKFSNSHQNKTDYKTLKIGDQVGLYNPVSDKFEQALAEGTLNGVGTPNTHTGYISDIKDGVPYVTHNIHGHVMTVPWKQARVMWVADPFPYHKDNLWGNVKDFFR